MPVFKYFAVAGSSLLVLLFVSDAYFGDGESHSRFNGSLYESAMYAPRLEEKQHTPELRFSPATPRRPTTSGRCSHGTFLSGGKPKR